MVSPDAQDHAGMSPASGQPCLANTERNYVVTASDLPLCCPMPDMILWNSHPRVYLPITESGGRCHCPYCGTRFELVGDRIGPVA